MQINQFNDIYTWNVKKLINEIYQYNQNLFSI